MKVRVSLPLDQDLLAQAAQILGTTDPSDTVNRALEEAVQHPPLGSSAASEDEHEPRRD